VVGCYLTEDFFLEKEGIFLLIDLLEVREVSTFADFNLYQSKHIELCL
jgi:hypothetical protein